MALAIRSRPHTSPPVFREAKLQIANGKVCSVALMLNRRSMLAARCLLHLKTYFAKLKANKTIEL